MTKREVERKREVDSKEGSIDKHREENHRKSIKKETSSLFASTCHSLYPF